MAASTSTLKEGKIIRETIGVYCRLRPPIPEDEYVWDGDDDADANNGESRQELPLVRSDGFSSVSQQPIAAGDIKASTGGSSKSSSWGTFQYRKSPQDSTSKEFRFHGFFGPIATQEQVYEAAGRDIVRGVLQGYNGTIFAYGQTGSGKTYTMRGGALGGGRGGHKEEEEELRGLTPRALQDIFEGIRASSSSAAQGPQQPPMWSVTLSYLQIYCEMLQDLFDPSNTNLSIRERDGRVYVEGLSRVPVQTLRECMRLLEEGDANRSTASTRLNASSSRSHAALIVHVTRREAADSNNLSDGSTLIESTLYLVDLAGSERAKRSGATFQRLEELKAINLSLSALGNCISALSQGRPHIPYRDSKLTRLLQQSLGGNSRTSLVVNVPPGHDVLGESHCSLLFAQRTMAVAVVAKVNRQIDYAHLYTTAQAKLDQHDDTLTRLQLEKAKQDQEVGELQSRVEELVRDKAELSKKLMAAEAGFKEGLRALESTSSDPGGERAVAAVETVSHKWRAEVEHLESLHAKEVRELKAKYDKRQAALKHSLDQANEGWQAVELELTREREGHLATLTDYRKCHDRLLQSESESSARIAELLSEVNDKTNSLEELQAQLEAARDRAKQREEILGKLQLKVRDLEAQLQEQSGGQPGAGCSSTNMNEAVVPKSQVETMEKLFAETVGRLEDRVLQLENVGAPPPVTTSSRRAAAGLSHSSSSSSVTSRTGSLSGGYGHGSSRGGLTGGGSSSARSTGSLSNGSSAAAYAYQQPAAPPALWATRRAAPAAASSGMRRVIEPGRPRASSFHGGGTPTGSSVRGLGAAGRYGSSNYRAYHL